MIVISLDERRQAQVIECDDGLCVVHYYRRGLSDARGVEPGTERGFIWRYSHSARMPQPFHVALNLAQKILDATEGGV